MVINYLEILTKCRKCGKNFSRAQSAKCPHKFNDKITQMILEGKLSERGAWESRKP